MSEVESSLCVAQQSARLCVCLKRQLYIYICFNKHKHAYVCGLYYMAYVRQLRIVYTHWLTTTTKLTWHKASVRACKGDSAASTRLFRSRLSSHDICRLHGKFIEHVSRSAFFNAAAWEKERECTAKTKSRELLTKNHRLIVLHCRKCIVQHDNNTHSHTHTP